MAASVLIGLALVVIGASNAWPSALSALAARSGTGCEPDSAGSSSTIVGRTNGPLRPGAWRWPWVICAAERVVGTAATRLDQPAASPSQADATALATSITRPPP